MTVVFYDGVCKFCDKFVNYIIEHDSKDEFRFAALQNPLAKTKLQKYGFDSSKLDTFYIITDFDTADERIYRKSTAGLVVFKQLGGFLGFLSSIGLIFPSFIRDPFYMLISETRYSVFGKYDACKIPDQRIMHKFLD